MDEIRVSFLKRRGEGKVGVSISSSSSDGRMNGTEVKFSSSYHNFAI